MIDEAIYRQGAACCRGHKKIYAINDTTVLEISHEKLNDELGPIDHYPNHLGALLHTTMAISEKGLPLGILNQQLWVREKKAKKPVSPKEREKEKKERQKRPIEEKESNKWLKAVSLSNQILADELGEAVPTTIYIGDRESDIFEFFEKIKAESSGAITRVTYNRRVEEAEGKLRDHLLAQQVAKKITIDMPRQGNRKKRKATVSIRYVPQVTILAPPNKTSVFPEIRLGAVYVREDNPPENIKPREVVDWFILTTEPVENIGDALDIIGKYKYRWLIEMLHFVLKSGCRIENLQFETLERYHKILSLLTLVAFELLRLTHFSRISPKAPASELLTEVQLKVLKIKTRTRDGPNKTLTIKEAVALIGRMGGIWEGKEMGRQG